MPNFLHLGRTDEAHLSLQHFLVRRDASLHEIVVNQSPLISESTDHLGTDIAVPIFAAFEELQGRADREDDAFDLQLGQGIRCLQFIEEAIIGFVIYAHLRIIFTEDVMRRLFDILEGLHRAQIGMLEAGPLVDYLPQGCQFLSADLEDKPEPALGGGVHALAVQI